MKTILVSGAAGFIGTNLVKTLHQKGHKLILVDNFNSFLYSYTTKRKNIAEVVQKRNVYLHTIDITQYDQLLPIFTNNKIDTVIHLAGRGSVQESDKYAINYVRDNIGGTTVLLELCAKFKIKEFILASSSAVYGDSPNFPYTEDMTINNPISIYGSTKKACELIMNNYCQLYGIKGAAVRLFTVYGPNNRPDMAVFKFAQKINTNVPVIIYRGSTQVYRDWIYIDDVTDALERLIEKLGIQTKNFEVYNIGSTESISVDEMVSLIAENLNKTPIINIEPPPFGDPLITHADISKIENFIGPLKRTSPEEGVKKFVEWFKNCDIVNNKSNL